MATLTRKKALHHDFEVVLLEREAVLVNELVNKYRNNSLTPNDAVIGIGVIAGMRSLLKKLDKEAIGHE